LQPFGKLRINLSFLLRLVLLSCRDAACCVSTGDDILKGAIKKYSGNPGPPDGDQEGNAQKIIMFPGLKLRGKLYLCISKNNSVDKTKG